MEKPLGLTTAAANDYLVFEIASMISLEDFSKTWLGARRGSVDRLNSKDALYIPAFDADEYCELVTVLCFVYGGDANTDMPL